MGVCMHGCGGGVVVRMRKLLAESGLDASGAVDLDGELTSQAITHPPTHSQHRLGRP